MSESPFVSEEEVASTPGPWFGLTPRQVRWDVRNGHLPGTINHRGKLVLRRSEWNEWLEETPTPAGAEGRKPVGIVSIRDKAS